MLIIENKQVKIINIKEGIYIPSIEACWLYKLNTETGDYKIDEKYLDKLLNGKLDYSFELVFDEELINNIEVKEYDGLYYSLDIVNVKYKNKYKKGNEEKTTRELREWTYENGFMFNGKLMSNWKRSGGKARVGQNLFLIDSIKDKCLEWARMGLEFDDNIDIGSIRAYESLPLSSIIGTIDGIKPENILVIDDFESKFDWKMSKTWLENKKLITKTDINEECNSIWDGEGLLSNKIFEANELIKGKGVCLLRNRYTKCAAFACRLDKFFKEYCDKHGYDYETYEVEDIGHNKIKVKSILLITTPSAIKISKYNNKVLKKEGYENGGDRAWLKYWKDNCGSTFAVCKTDKPTRFQYGNTLSYQMVNTIPFEDINELALLVQYEKDSVDRLKNDLEYFLEEVDQLKEISEELEQEYNLNENEEDDNEVEIGSNIDVAGAFIELAKRNSQFTNTQVFKDYRRNFINAYVKRLRQGKIRVKDADYCIACGNPIELLYATVGEFHGESLTLKDNELYCSRFKIDGETVIGFRNPHINFSNIGIQVFRENQLIKDYMYTTPNIVYLNSIKYPILSTYQGQDFDIDCNYLTNDPIIIKACGRINKSINGIPVNKVENTGKNNKELTAKNMSDVDHIISQNFIGSTINLSQELNSLMNHARYNNLLNAEEINNIYDMTSKCSSISCCEIDKCKRQFEDLDVQKELDEMKEGLELVDNKQIKYIESQIRESINDFRNKKKEVMEYRALERKPYKRELRELNETMRIHNTEILTKDRVKELQEEVINLESELSNITNKEERKPILKKLSTTRKILNENEIEKLTDKEIKEINEKILLLNEVIHYINLERQEEIDIIKEEIAKKRKELSEYDSRRIKPYFFKYIGDNESKKQRKKTNKKHKKELNKATIKKYAAENNIDLDKVDMKDEKLVELLKANNKIQEEWENKIYRKLDTPMDWLQTELDKITLKKPVATIQVIQLVKKNKHKANEETVTYIVNCIKYLDTKIRAYRSNDDLTSKEKLNKIRLEKKRVVKEVIRYMKLNKAELYGVLKKCLNSVKKNGKVDKKSSIESLTLEILFKAYGTGLLDMFIQ